MCTRLCLANSGPMARYCRMSALLRLLALAWIGGIACFVLLGHQPPGAGITTDETAETHSQIKQPRPAPAGRLPDARTDPLDKLHRAGLHEEGLTGGAMTTEPDPSHHHDATQKDKREDEAGWKANHRANEGRLKSAPKHANGTAAVCRANPVVAFELQIGPGEVGTVLLEVHCDWAPVRNGCCTTPYPPSCAPAPACAGRAFASMWCNESESLAPCRRRRAGGAHRRGHLTGSCPVHTPYSLSAWVAGVSRSPVLFGLNLGL